MSKNYLRNLGPFSAVGRAVRSGHNCRDAFTLVTVNNPKILPEFQIEFAQSIAEALNERDKLREACEAALSRGCANLGQLADHDDTIRLLRAALWPNSPKPPSKVAGEA